MNYHHDPITTIHALPEDDTPDTRISLGEMRTEEHIYSLGNHIRIGTRSRISTAPRPAWRFGSNRPLHVNWSEVPADWGIETTIKISGKSIVVRCQPA